MLRALTLLYFELLIFKLSSPPAGFPSSRLFQDVLLPHPHPLRWLHRWIIIIAESTHFATCSITCFISRNPPASPWGGSYLTLFTDLETEVQRGQMGIDATWHENGSSAQEPKHWKLFCDASASSSRQCWLPDNTVPKHSELGGLKMWSVPHQTHVHGVI